MSAIAVEYRDGVLSGDVHDFISRPCVSTLTSREIGESHVAYVALIDGEICGAMVFTEFKEKSQWWIELSFVDKKHRRKGIHTMLFEALKGHAESVGIDIIQCEVVNSNDASRKAMEAQGRKAFSTIYRYTTRKEE